MVNKHFKVEEYKEVFLEGLGRSKVITGKFKFDGGESDAVRIIMAKREENILLCTCMETYHYGDFDPSYYEIQDLMPFLEGTESYEVTSELPPYEIGFDDEDYSYCHRIFSLLTQEEFKIIKQLFFDETVKSLLS